MGNSLTSLSKGRDTQTKENKEKQEKQEARIEKPTEKPEKAAPQQVEVATERVAEKESDRRMEKGTDKSDKAQKLPVSESLRPPGKFSPARAQKATKALPGARRRNTHDFNRQILTYLDDRLIWFAAEQVPGRLPKCYRPLSNHVTWSGQKGDDDEYEYEYETASSSPERHRQHFESL